MALWARHLRMLQAIDERRGRRSLPMRGRSSLGHAQHASGPASTGVAVAVDRRRLMPPSDLGQACAVPRVTTICKQQAIGRAPHARGLCQSAISAQCSWCSCVCGTTNLPRRTGKKSDVSTFETRHRGPDPIRRHDSSDAWSGLEDVAQGYTFFFCKRCQGRACTRMSRGELSRQRDLVFINP